MWVRCDCNLVFNWPIGFWNGLDIVQYKFKKNKLVTVIDLRCTKHSLQRSGHSISQTTHRAFIFRTNTGLKLSISYPNMMPYHVID